MHPDCRWRTVPVITPTRAVVGGQIFSGDFAVLDGASHVIALFGSEAVATVASLAHNSSIEGSLEALGRSQLLSHMAGLQKQVVALQAQLAALHLAPVALPARKHLGGRKAAVHQTLHGEARSTGPRVKSYTPMRCDDGTQFFYSRKFEAFTAPHTEATSRRLSEYDAIPHVEKP